jgi:hypothetical protein
VAGQVEDAVAGFAPQQKSGLERERIFRLIPQFAKSVPVGVFLCTG